MEIGLLLVLQKKSVQTCLSEKYYLCQCDCGTVREIVDRSLRRLLSTSCGCSRVESQKKVHSILGATDLKHFIGETYGNWRDYHMPNINHGSLPGR